MLEKQPKTPAEIDVNHEETDLMESNLQQEEQLEELLFSGKEQEIIDNLEKFSEVDEQWLVYQLIKAGYGVQVVEKINKFPDLDQQWLAGQLIDRNLGRTIVSHLDFFDHLDHQWLAKELINNGQMAPVIHNLDKFPDLDTKFFAIELIKFNSVSYIFENLDKFPDLDLSWLAKIIVAHKRVYRVVDYLDQFNQQDQKWLVEKLLESGYTDALARNLDKVANLDQKWLAEMFFQRGQGPYVAENLEAFSNVSRLWLAKQLAKAGLGITIFENIAQFPFVELKWAAQKIFDQGQGYKLTSFIKLFDQNDQRWLAEKFFERNLGHCVIFYIDNYENIDFTWVAQKLIEAHEIHLLARYLEKFNSVDRDWLAEQLVIANYGKTVTENFDKFASLDRRKLAEQLFAYGQGDAIFVNIDQFSSVDRPWILEKSLQAQLENEIGENFYWFFQIGGESLIEKIVQSNNLGSGTAIGLLQYAPSINESTQRLLLSKIFPNDTENNLSEPNTGREFNLDEEDINQEIELDEEDMDVETDRRQERDGEDLPQISKRLVELVEFKTPEIIAWMEKLTPRQRDELVKFYEENQFYKSLNLLITSFGYQTEHLGWTWETLGQKLDKLVTERNLAHAADLLLCAKSLFPDHQTEIENLEKTLAPEVAPKKIENRPRYEKIDPTREIFDYYVSLILANTHNLDSIPKEIRELVFQPVESLFQKVREYILLAVSSEMVYTPDQRGVNRYGKFNSLMYHAASDEDIRLFFQRAAQNFGTVMANQHTFGGPAWARVADYGHQIWAEDVETSWQKKIFLLNVVVGIQHNNGYFFDKDDNRVRFDEHENDALEHLLDFEASGDHDLESFLHYGLEHQIINLEEYNQYLALQSKIEAEQSLKNLAPELVHKLFASKISRQLEALSHDQDLPHEVRLSVSNYFSPDKGFAIEQDGFTLLGKLLGTMNVNWQNTDELVKKFTKDDHELYFISIEGFKLGYWYQNGALKVIKSQGELHNLALQLSELLDKQIVRAQLGSLREGD